MMRNTDNDKSGLSSGMFREAAAKELLKAKRERLKRFSTYSDLNKIPVPELQVQIVEEKQPKEKASHLKTETKSFWRTRETVDVNIYETSGYYIVDSFLNEKSVQMPHVVLNRTVVDALPVMTPPEVVVSEHGHNKELKSPKKGEKVPAPPSEPKSSNPAPTRNAVTVVGTDEESNVSSWDRVQSLTNFIMSRIKLESGTATAAAFD